MSRNLLFASILLLGCGSSPTTPVKRTVNEPAKAAAVPPPAPAPVKPVEVPKPMPVKDDFAVGSKFKGRRTIPNGDQTVSLVVTKRDGADFEGELTVAGERLKPLTVKVTGKAGLSSGTVAFSTDKAGNFQQSFTGDYKDGKLTFEFRGKARNNQDATGKGVLERQK